MRGPGDLFGIRQSGLMDFKIGDIYQDADLLKAAGNMRTGCCPRMKGWKNWSMPCLESIWKIY